jgi:thiamine monophosphate synthase
MKIYNNSYLLTNQINETIKKNILKFKNISIIYYNINEDDKKKCLNESRLIYNFCKQNNLPFFITNDINLCLKYKCRGLFLTNAKGGRNFTYLKNQLHIIGKAHTQIEYNLLINRGCKAITLSPLFYNKKYSRNKILGPMRFNLLTKNWQSEVYALGGINQNNIKKINLLQKNKGIVFKNFIKEL